MHSTNIVNIFQENSIPVSHIASQHIQTVSENAILCTAAKILAESKISSLVVVDEKGNSVGIITEKNILQSFGLNSCEEIPVSRAMSAPLISISEKTSCRDAYLLCLRKGVRHLALTNERGELSGVVSETDFRLHLNLIDVVKNREVNTVMSRSILVCGPEENLSSAAIKMEKFNTTCIIIVEDEKPEGILTERDIVQLFAKGIRKTSLGSVMSAPVLRMSVNDSVQEAARRMMEKGVRHLVVVDRNESLVGLVREHDLTQALALQLIDSGLEKEFSFLRTLIDTIPDPVWLKNPDGVYLACNPRFEDFFGASEHEISGKTDYDFLDSDLADFFREKDRRAMEIGRPSVNEEWIVFANDGHRELLETIKTPMYDRSGELIGVLGIGRNITESWKDKKTLRESEKKLRSLIEAIPDSVQFKDGEGRWLAYNQMAARAFGLDGVNCLGKKDTELAEITDPFYRSALLECGHSDRQALSTGEILHIKETVPREDCSNAYFEVTKIPLEMEGEEKGLVVLARDVTESRRMTLALEKSLNDFNELVTTIPVGVFKFHSEKNGSYEFDYVSPRLCKMIDVSVDEIYKNASVLFKNVHPEDRDSFIAEIESSLTEGTPFKYEGRAIIQGETRWFHLEATPVENRDGRIDWNGIHIDITDRKLAEQKLTLIDFALNYITDAAFLTDMEANIVYVNEATVRSTGYSREELLQCKVFDLDPNISSENWNRILGDIRSTGSISLESIHRKKDGSNFPVEVQATHFEYLGQDYTLGMARDITERKKSEENLRQAASVFANTHDGIIITDEKGMILDVNDSFTRITGYDREEAIGQNPKILQSGKHGAEFYDEMWRNLKRNNHWSGEIWNRMKDGKIYAEHLAISGICNEQNEVIQYVGVFSDISTLKEHEQRLELIAHYDLLTGIPNRVLLSDRLNQAMNLTQRQDSYLAICYLDLDGFKPVNDTLGHDAGDKVLIIISDRMKSLLRGSDTVSRIGGDEFVILLPGLASIEACHSALERILATISEPLQVNGRTFSISASIGVTIYPDDSTNPDTLLRHADQAMYQAKSGGKNRYQLFDPENDRQLKINLVRKGEILRSLERDEFVLHYQPQVDLVDGRVTGLEALVRWNHPEKGLLAPSEFLSTIEGSDTEVLFGEQILESALKQIDVWSKSGIDLNVSVNIGANHLLKDEFSERLKALFKKYPYMSPGRLELEILESTAIHDMEKASHSLTSCRKLGVSFALDDFGTGYSSLTYFRQLPVQTLKIDQSFVIGMLEDPEDLGIVESVIQLAGAFNRTVIAEGAETEKHCAVLSRMGCRLAQGYGISKPIPAWKVPEWIRSWKEEKRWEKFREIPMPERPEDLVLQTATESHVKWIEQLVEYLKNPDSVKRPPIDSHQCKFGIWFHGIGSMRYGDRPSFENIDLLHRRIHKIAEDLVELSEENRNEPAIELLDELYRYRDEFVTSMNLFIDSFKIQK